MSGVLATGSARTPARVPSLPPSRRRKPLPVVGLGLGSSETVLGSSVSISVSVSVSVRCRTVHWGAGVRDRDPFADRPQRQTLLAQDRDGGDRPGVSLEGGRGPLRSGTSALTPAANSAFAQRHRVDGEVSNAAATCAWVPALIRVADTAANRRPAVSPASRRRTVPMHEDPAPVLVLDRRGRGTDLGSADGSSGKGG